MNYELAKKLKDAGFPQEKCMWHFGGIGVKIKDSLQVGETYQAEVKVEPYKQEWVAKPTLSELIEACGKEFMLTNECGKWEAWKGSESLMVRMGEGGAKYECEGSTPEEAVAQLWLALNPNLLTPNGERE